MSFFGKSTIRIILNMFTGQFFICFANKEPRLLFQSISLKSGPLYPAVSMTGRSSCKLVN